MDFLSSIDDAYGRALMCPHCGFDHIHHVTATSYDRDSEDADHGRIAQVFESHVIVLRNAEMTDNQSPRRNSISILFECEGCGKLSQLHIIQHKGQTFIRSARVMPFF